MTPAEKIIGSLYGIGVDSGNRLGVMLAMLEDATDDVFWPVFSRAWSTCDDTWYARDHLLKMLRRRNRNGSPWKSGWFDDLPDELTVFRGCSSPRIRGLSCSLNRNVAAAFARGHRNIRVSAPVIASVRLCKEDGVVLFATDDREERELLLDYDKLCEPVVETAGEDTSKLCSSP